MLTRHPSEILMLDSHALLLICSCFQPDSQPKKCQRPSQSRYHRSSNALWYVPTGATGLWVSRTACWISLSSADLAKASAVSTHVGVKKGLLSLVRATLNEVLFESERRGGLDLWLLYSKMMPSSRPNINPRPGMRFRITRPGRGGGRICSPYQLSSYEG